MHCEVSWRWFLPQILKILPIKFSSVVVLVLLLLSLVPQITQMVSLRCRDAICHDQLRLYCLVFPCTRDDVVFVLCWGSGALGIIYTEFETFGLSFIAGVNVS